MSDISCTFTPYSNTPDKEEYIFQWRRMVLILKKERLYKKFLRNHLEYAIKWPGKPFISEKYVYNTYSWMETASECQLMDFIVRELPDGVDNMLRHFYSSIVSFNWAYSPEGHTFWEDNIQRIKEKYIYKPSRRRIA